MADMSITIRDCAEADLDGLERHDPRPGAHLARDHFAAAQQGDSRFLVAYADNEPAAWGMLETSDEELTPQLAHLWVFPEYRRHGVGRHLSEYIEAAAKELGHEEIFLMVDPDNGKAVALWLDLGYKATGEHQLGETVESGQQTHQAIYRKSLKSRKSK